METRSGRDRRARWREDFPVRWEKDHYIGRRELAKFLTLGSGLLVAMSTLIAAVGRWRADHKKPESPRRIGLASAVPDGGSFLFRYPSDDDPCIAVRSPAGTVVAYSQVCTHLSCAIVHRPGADMLWCPCHNGSFSVADGRPAGGPPTRRLPRIRLEQRGDEIWAVGREA